MKRALIRDIYRQVQAPDWAAPNLDGLADVLRDLSWLPEGPVEVEIRPSDDLETVQAVVRVVTAAVVEGHDSARPLSLRVY